MPAFTYGAMSDLGSITCPVCSTTTVEHMPEDACLYLFVCPSCQVLLRPKPGDCCVFCSYGDVPCPPKQVERKDLTLIRTLSDVRGHLDVSRPDRS